MASVVLATAASLPTLAGDCVPPANEVCDNAIVFTNADLPYAVSAPLGCVNDVIDRPYFDIFYRFDCSQTGTYFAAWHEDSEFKLIPAVVDMRSTSRPDPADNRE